MTYQRNVKTRSQKKREKIQTAVMAAALMILWLMLSVAFFKVWTEHPAEQPVSGVEYLESIRNGGENHGNP